MVELSKRERFRQLIDNENHQAFLKTKVNEYHCQIKEKQSKQSPMAKISKGEKF
jgi:hypothetical protein